MVEFKKQLGNFMTTNSFGSSAQQAEIMIKVIKYLISEWSYQWGRFPIPCLIFVLWTFLINTHLQGGRAVKAVLLFSMFVLKSQMPVCPFTFICSVCPCSIRAVKTCLGNSMLYNGMQDNQWFVLLSETVWKVTIITFSEMRLDSDIFAYFYE